MKFRLKLFIGCLLICLLSGCGNSEKKVVGSWEFDDSEISDDFGYAVFSGANSIILTDDGTFFTEKSNGNGERCSGEYSFAGDEIYLTTKYVNGTHGTNTYTYKYKVSGDKLTFSNQQGSITCYK